MLGRPPIAFRPAFRAALATSALALVASPRIAAAQAASPTPTPAPFASDERPLFLPQASVADPGGADAIVFNPAALGLEPGGEMVYVHADGIDRDRPGDGDALYLKNGGLNVGIEWGRPAREIDHTLFTFGGSLPMGDDTAVGVSYATSFGRNLSDLEYKNYTLGFLTRPGRWLSLGGSLWNARGTLERPGFDLRTRYAGGAALRPFGNERFTLAADVAKTDGQEGEDVRFSLRAEPAHGIGVFATADDAERWSAGLTFSFTYGDVGSHAFTDSEGELAGTSTRLRVRERRRPTILRRTPSYARIVVGGPMPDWSEGSLLDEEETTLPDILQAIATARRDPTVDGILLRINGAGSGLASAQELRAAIQATRDAKKKVLCYFDQADFRMYYVASACERIAMNPAGTISIEGLFSGLAYLKGTLDKLGVQVEAVRAGEYKGAPEPFLATEPSKETLEVTNDLLDGAFAQMVDGMAAGRGIDPAKMRELVDGAFYEGPKALEARLVDFTFYPDELEEKAKEYLGNRFTVVRGYRSVAPAPAEWGAPPKIAVVYASGAITEGESSDGGFFGEANLGSRTAVRALREAKDDGSVRAVVLRVDSPGGSGFASDEIWHEVAQVRKSKPVVVSMGDVAASGGYYVSMGANEIFALPGTITGSIGVFFLKPNFARLYEKYEYRRFDFSRGALGGMFTEARPFDERERAVAEKLIDDFYAQFIRKAAEGRATTPEAIDAVGRGRVWLGSRAREIKLVDKTGGLEDAIARAKELAHIPAHRHVEWLELPRARGLFDSMTDDGPGPAEARVAAEVRAATARMPFAAELARLELASAIGPGVAAWFPHAPAWSAAPAAPAERRAHAAETRARNPWWPLPARFAPAE